MNTAPSAAAMHRRDFLASVATGVAGALLINGSRGLAAESATAAQPRAARKICEV